MRFFNSKFFAVILIILGIALIGFGIFSFISADLNTYLNVLLPLSLGLITLGLCSVVGGLMGIRARRLTYVFYIPFIIVAVIFFAIIAYKLVF